MNIPIQCQSCGAIGSVGRVTANLQCKCGSTDLDLYEGEMPKTAAPKGPGTGWGQAQPDRLQGWNEYVGPGPGKNPLTPQGEVNGVGADGSQVCPACNGTGINHRASGGGYDEGATCRECNGTGRKYAPTTKPATETDDVTTQGPSVGGARWAGFQPTATITNGSMTTTVPITITFPTNQTLTTGSNSTHTALVNALPWFESDPKEDKLQRIIATIKSKNALSDQEARALAERTVELYPENEF